MSDGRWDEFQLNIRWRFLLWGSLYCRSKQSLMEGAEIFEYYLFIY